MATDYCLTVFSYHYALHWQGYVTTWAWYVAAMALGQILLHTRTTFVRVAAGVVLGPTPSSCCRIMQSGLRVECTPHTLAGLQACYIAALPFYRNDLASTAIVAGLAFGIPVLLRRLNTAHATPALQKPSASCLAPTVCWCKV